jgi:integrase
MGLSLYRRHRRDCKAGHSEESRSGEFEERKKGWKRCDCPIFASGSLNKIFKRQSTGKWEWDDAKIIASEWAKTGDWDGPLPQVAGDAVESKQRVPIERAVKAFLNEFQEHASFATQKKYRLILKQFTVFSEQRGFVMIDEWGPAYVREFRSSWNVGPQTAPRRMSMLRGFFEYCFSNEWTDRNPARMVRNPRSRDAGDRRNEQKLPFTDEELKAMYTACDKYPSSWRFTWTGKDIADFISISVYTGLRISDVALFHIDRMQPETGEILVRTTKAGTHVYTWVPEWLQERIKERSETVGPYIFGEHTSKVLDVITETWRRKLNRLWDICGAWKHKPTPHRFRHTFARILLQRGVTVRDVADLLGNSEAMVRKHYAAWIPERQARLTKILKEAFEDKPKPKLLAINRQ